MKWGAIALLAQVRQAYQTRAPGSATAATLGAAVVDPRTARPGPELQVRLPQGSPIGIAAWAAGPAGEALNVVGRRGAKLRQPIRMYYKPRNEPIRRKMLDSVTLLRYHLGTI